MFWAELFLSNSQILATSISQCDYIRDIALKNNYIKNYMDEINLGWPLLLKNKESRTMIYFRYTEKRPFENTMRNW